MLVTNYNRARAAYSEYPNALAPNTRISDLREVNSVARALKQALINVEQSLHEKQRAFKKRREELQNDEGLDETERALKISEESQALADQVNDAQSEAMEVPATPEHLEAFKDALAQLTVDKMSNGNSVQLILLDEFLTDLEKSK